MALDRHSNKGLRGCQTKSGWFPGGRLLSAAGPIKFRLAKKHPSDERAENPPRVTCRDGRSKRAEMPGGEHHVTGRGFEDAFRNDARETERGGPCGDAVIGAAKEFKTHHGGQTVCDSGEPAQAVGENERRCCKRGQQSARGRAAEYRDSRGELPMLQLDVGEEERGGI